jgi:hypothetical protein
MKLRLTLCLLAATLTSQAEVSLPKLFSSHMVLQRDMPIHVWGSAAPGESVTATFHDLTNTATTDATGRWSVYLPAQPAGRPIHPHRSRHQYNKQAVGECLSLIARHLVYGEDIVSSGPLVRLAYPDHAVMHVWFDNAIGLHAKEGSLEGFEVAGPDHVFLTASAHIDHAAGADSITLSNPSIPNPQYVRYAWANFPKANLYNRANLPASTFTTLEPPTQP